MVFYKVSIWWNGCIFVFGLFFYDKNSYFYDIVFNWYKFSVILNIINIFILLKKLNIIGMLVGFY